MSNLMSGPNLTTPCPAQAAVGPVLSGRPRETLDWTKLDPNRWLLRGRYDRGWGMGTCVIGLGPLLGRVLRKKTSPDRLSQRSEHAGRPDSHDLHDAGLGCVGHAFPSLGDAASLSFVCLPVCRINGRPGERDDLTVHRPALSPSAGKRQKRQAEYLCKWLVYGKMYTSGRSYSCHEVLPLHIDQLGDPVRSERQDA